MTKLLKIQEYLRDTSNSLATMADTYSIAYKHSLTHPNLVLLKYDQINSPMALPLVQECRGIILDAKNNYSVVSRPFDKFFNHGETNAADINWNDACVYEKLDGSLITLYYYDNKWCVSTSGTPDASSPVGDHQMTFAELFWKVFNDNGYVLDGLPTNKSYMFELMTPYNRVVVRHDYNRLVLIGVRNLDTQLEEAPSFSYTDKYKWEVVRTFDIRDVESITKSFESMDPVQQEGYVVSDTSFRRVKIKHPKYVIIHHARGSYSYKNMIDLVRKGEHSEFVSYYQEYDGVCESIELKLSRLKSETESILREKIHIQNQKEFALAIADATLQGALFSIRAGKCKDVGAYIADMNIDKLSDILERY